MLEDRSELARSGWLRHSLPDEEVARRVTAGEPELFELLMRRHNQRLFRVARAILRDDLEAEDAVQSAYVGALQNLARFEGRSSYATWQTRLVIHEAGQRLRERRRRGDLLEDLARDDRAGDGSAPRGWRPDEGAAAAELRRVLEECVDRLPDGERLVFVMRRVEGLDTEQTAELLDTTGSAVKARLHRADKRLRKALERRLDLPVELTRTFPCAGERCNRIVAGVLRRT